MSTRSLNEWFVGLELADGGRDSTAFGLLLRALAIERGELGPVFLGLLGQELPLHGDEGWTRPRRRMKLAFGISALAQRGAQSRDVQLRRNEIIPDVLLLRRRHGGIEFNEDVARLDALPIVDVNGAHDAGLERLYQLDTAAGHDFAGCGRDDIDMPEACPDQRQAE